MSTLHGVFTITILSSRVVFYVKKGSAEGASFLTGSDYFFVRGAPQLLHVVEPAMFNVPQ